MQLLGGDDVDAAPPAAAYDVPASDAPSAENPPPAATTDRPAVAVAPAASDATIATAELVGRVEHLERELAALRTELHNLREQLGG